MGELPRAESSHQPSDKGGAVEPFTVFWHVRSAGTHAGQRFCYTRILQTCVQPSYNTSPVLLHKLAINQNASIRSDLWGGKRRGLRTAGMSPGMSPGPALQLDRQGGEESKPTSNPGLLAASIHIRVFGRDLILVVAVKKLGRLDDLDGLSIYG